MAKLGLAERLLLRFFATGLPKDAISYPLRVVGDDRSALVEFEDLPAAIRQ